MATTTSDEGFHEIQLNGKQLVFLFMAVTVVSVVIFLLGVMVGRGVRAEQGPTDPLAAAEVATAATETPEPPAVTAAPAEGAPATAAEELSYPNRLGNNAAPAEVLRDTPAPASRRSNPAADAKPATASKPPAAAASTVSNTTAEPAGAGFAIQLTALARREEAEGIVKRLAAKGYSAYVMEPGAGAPTVFRVRVGKFKERREAEAVASRLQKEEQFNPWIVR
jgi:cell division septation protein DedD